jgi:hypothetical protein
VIGVVSEGAADDLLAICSSGNGGASEKAES